MLLHMELSSGWIIIFQLSHVSYQLVSCTAAHAAARLNLAGCAYQHKEPLCLNMTTSLVLPELNLNSTWLCPITQNIVLAVQSLRNWPFLHEWDIVTCPAVQALTH